MTELPIEDAPHPWSTDALLNKAQRYAEEMERTSQDEWQYALWSTLLLELLARAALAKVSPVLLADNTDWANIYYGLGLSPNKQSFKPKSAAISDVLTRLQNAVPNFTDEIRKGALAHIGRRNEELHSGGTPLDGLGSSKWLANFYEAAAVLLEFLGQSLATFFSEQTAALAVQVIQAARDEAAKSVKQDIHNARTRWEGLDDDERATLSQQAAVVASRLHGHRVRCPACGSTTLVGGTPAGPPRTELRGDKVIERQAMLPSVMQCPACRLLVVGASRLTVAGVGDVYTLTQEHDLVDYFAAEDEYDGPEPDFNEWGIDD